MLRLAYAYIIQTLWGWAIICRRQFARGVILTGTKWTPPPRPLYLRELVENGGALSRAVNWAFWINRSTRGDCADIRWIMLRTHPEPTSERWLGTLEWDGTNITHNARIRRRELAL